MHSKLFKFFISRLIGTIVDTLILWILSHFIFTTYFGKYIISPAISFEVAMLNNYIISYLWIWDKNILVKNVKDFFIRLLKYNLSTILGFAFKMGFLLLFERLFRWNVVYCNIAALMISGVVNFILAEYVVFRKPVLGQLVEGFEMENQNKKELVDEKT